ncbi:MAG: hypothetical protein IJY94_01130 [Clostridia bacterium]|nr:hypothetical protein [Clostridia bacterium]
MILQAHRGDSKRFPENTMSAFRAAYDEGYGIIELDMKFTKDNRCVILHDFSLARTARNLDASPLENDIKISDVIFDDLAKYDFGVYMSERFKGEKIPTLEDVFNFACENKVKLKFDNVLQRFTDEQIDSFFDAVAEHHEEEIFGFTSNDLAFTERIVKRFPSCDIHYDGPVNYETLEKLKKVAPNNPLYIWLPLNKMPWLEYPAADMEQVELAKKYGLVGLWIITDPSDLARCVELGADVIETDGAITTEML